MSIFRPPTKIATPNTTDATRPIKPPMTTELPDVEVVSALSKNNTVSKPSRTTATNAMAKSAVFADLSTLARNSVLKDCEFERIQKIICVRTAAATSAIVPSVAISTLPFSPSNAR